MACNFPVANCIFDFVISLVSMKITKTTSRAVIFCVALNIAVCVNSTLAQTTNATHAPARTNSTQPPTLDPHTEGYVAATELPDGEVPPANVDGNFIIGPTHTAARDATARTGGMMGQVFNFTMSSADSKIYPGIARDPGTSGKPDPNDPAKLIVTTSHPAPYTRKVEVYVPKQYVPGTAAPFIVGADGPDNMLFVTLDNLIAEKK